MYSKINDSIWPVFELIQDCIRAPLCTFQEDPIKTECVTLMTKLNNCYFQQSRGRNSKINDPIWPVCKLNQDFIRVHLICKFQEDPNQNWTSYADDKVSQIFSAIKGMQL